MQNNIVQEVNNESPLPPYRPIWERFDPRLRFGKHLLCYQRVESTMDVAWDLHENGSREGTAVITLEQERGRGRFGRNWVFERSGSLALSVIVHPPPTVLSLISLTMAWAVVNAIGELTGTQATIKWPNDVRIASKKVAGILTEVRVDTKARATAVIGIGMNLAFDFAQYAELHGKATSLSSGTGAIVEMEAAANSILYQFDKAYHDSMNNPDNPRPWLNVVDTIGKRITITDGPEQYSGIAKGISESGELIVLRDDGQEVHVGSGEITSISN